MGHGQYWVDVGTVRGVHLQCTVAAQLWAANPVWWDMAVYRAYTRYIQHTLYSSGTHPVPSGGWAVPWAVWMGGATWASMVVHTVVVRTVLY